MTTKLIITILAAGEGKRMNSNIPKVLHIFNGKPMLVRIVETSLLLSPQKIIIVTGKHDELIKKTIADYIDITDLIFVNQTVPKGTGDAIKYCLPFYETYSEVLILNGDMPLINKRLLDRFIKNSSRYKASILVAKFNNPTGYGRIVVNNNANFIGIVEEKDCTDEQRKIKIINSGIYLFNRQILKDYIPMIDNNNAQNEYYLTDIVKIIKQNTDLLVYTDIIDEYENKYISGVNTPEELLKLELFII